MKLPSLFAAAWFAAGALSAASVPQMTFEDVVRSSPRAVRGIVSRTWSAWDESRRAIWTHYEIRVTDTLRGPSETIFTISEPGGVVGDLAMRVPGAPRLALGEEAVLFAYPTPVGFWRIRGWGQGLFRVEAGNSGPVVKAPAAGSLHLESGKSAALVRTPGSNLEVESLGSFLERVRELIRAGEGR